MKKLILLPVLCISGYLFSQPNLPKIDSIVTRAIKENYFEGSIAIAEQGKIIYQKHTGYANRSTQQKINSDTRFGIASITKMVTAIVTLQLVDEGKLSLQSNLSTLLPDLKINNGDSITVHHLLLHISGLPNESEDIYNKQVTPAEFVKQTLALPGNTYGQFNYANIDYVLLGLVIEKLTSHTWAQEVERRIVRKLGLTGTGFLAKDMLPARYAHTYTVSPAGKFTADNPIHIENYYASGCMYSTVHDLLKLDQAMYSTVLLSEAAKQKMFTSYPQFNYTGYSVWTYNYPFAKTKPRVMERRGGIYGSTSVIIRLLDFNKTIIILSNNDAFNPDSFGDSNNLREALLIALTSK